MTQQTPPKFMRPRLVKETFGVSVPTIHRWLKLGLIEGCSKPGMTLVEVKSVENYMATWKRRPKKGE